MMWIQFTILVSMVVFDAIGDATREDKKTLSHLSQSFCVLTGLILVIFYPGITWVDHIMTILLWYGVTRLFLFDLVWNTCKGNVPLDFIGGTSWWDITISKVLIKIKMPLFFWLWIKFIIWIAYSGAIITKYKI